MHPRCESFTAARAECPLSRLACLLIQLHAQLGGALEDVKELPEGQIQKRRNYGDGMQDGEKLVGRAAQPLRRHRERQAGNGYRKQEDDREKVHGEGLHRLRALLAHPPPQRQANAGQHQKRRNVQAVKDHAGDPRAQREGHDGKAENISDIRHRVFGQRPEMNPSEDERKGDGRGQQTSPEQTLVHPPAQNGPVANKRLRGNVRDRDGAQATQASENSLPVEELPASLPVRLRRRLLQPHVVVIGDSPGGKDRCERVDHQRRIEVLQVARADENRGDEQAGP